MNEEKNDQDCQPDLIAPADLPRKALQFVYGAAALIESILAEIDGGRTPQEEGQEVIRRILSDVKEELTEFPTKRTGATACSQCIFNYNNCHLPYAQCMTNYSYCVQHCS